MIYTKCVGIIRYPARKVSGHRVYRAEYLWLGVTKYGVVAVGPGKEVTAICDG